MLKDKELETEIEQPKLNQWVCLLAFLVTIPLLAITAEWVHAIFLSPWSYSLALITAYFVDNPTPYSSSTVLKEFEKQVGSKRNGSVSSFSQLSRSLAKPSLPSSSTCGRYFPRRMLYHLPNLRMGAPLISRFNLRCFGCHYSF